MIDWIYNRPRPLDDESPQFIANYYDYELYNTNTGNTQLVNTGGNFMSDGMGNAFASNLILEEMMDGDHMVLLIIQIIANQKLMIS